MVAGRRSLAPAGCGAPVRGLAVRPCLVPICGLAPPHCLAPIRHLAPPGTPNACRAQRSAGVSAKTRDLVLGTLVPLFVLNALLVFGNAWPTLWPRPTLAVSIELAFAVAALALAAAWRGRVPPALVRTLAGLVTLWVVLRYVQVTVPALFGRPLNLYWDLPHLGAVLDMGGDGSGARIVLAAALGTLVVLALHRVVSACVRALARGAGAPGARALLGGTAGTAILLWALAPWVGSVTSSAFARPVAPLVFDQIRFLRSALAADAADRLGAAPDFRGDLAALRGADVLIVFAEAYGAVTLDRAPIAAALAVAREHLATAIATSGRRAVSARVVSPTFGGASWLAHAAVLAGVDTRDPADYALLLTTDRPTLVRHFAAHGYRTVGWMPGLQRPWPEGHFYGFDRIADADSGGYAGLPFGFWRIPDQASLARIHVDELGGSFGEAGGAPQRGPGPGSSPDLAGDTTPDAPTYRPGAPAETAATRRAPRLVVFPTVTTHAPFAAIPPLREDWSRVLHADAFSREELDAAAGQPVSWTDPLPAYLASMRYQFGWLADYLARHAAQELVMIVIGDHQPVGTVGGPDQPWDVPVHVIASDPALLARFEAAGFITGLTPPQQPLGPMHELTQLLANAFSSPPRGTPPRNAPP